MRYCGFLSLPRAVLRYSYPLTPPPFTKRSSELSLVEFFFTHYWLSLLSQKVCCFLSSAVLLLIKVHFFEEQVIGLPVLQKDHDLFLPFFTYHERDRWHMKYECVFMLLFVCLFFFYLLSSYKRAWGQHKACLRLKVIRHNQAIPENRFT